MATLTEHASALDAKEAETLTRRIKTEINGVCLLLAEAHDRRAWAALGYATWDQYVRREIGYSRSRSYELLDQAREVRAIQAAAGSAFIPDISAYAARQIKPYLAEVVNEIREKVALAESLDSCTDIVNQVVAGARRRARSQHNNRMQTAHSHRADGSIIEVTKLFAAVNYIATRPPPGEEFLATLNQKPLQVDAIRMSIGWLVALARRIGVQDLPQGT